MPHSSTHIPALQRWHEQLAAMAVPDEILAAAPASPHGFDVAMFARIADEMAQEDTPSRRAGLAGLPPGGSVLDVGCGAGAGALALCPPAGSLIGVDESAEMLAAFADRAVARGVAHREIVGRWPDVADDTPPADVVVCHNVLYNVFELAPFVAALTEHASHRVVVELTGEHPLAWMRPYWQAIHGFDRPPGPTAEDAVAALDELGYAVEVTRWRRSSRLTREHDEHVAFVRQRLAVDTDRDAELQALLDAYPPPEVRSVVTIAWQP